MNQKATGRAPRARSEGLIAREVSGELLIYDSDRDKAHCLNETAALVWNYCDGKTSVPKMAQQLGHDLKVESVDEKIVWYALGELSKDHLLEESVALPGVLSGMSRRQMVRVLGLAAVVAIPLVTSIIAPTPAQSATLLPPGAPCTSGAQCASGTCTGGTTCL